MPGSGSREAPWETGAAIGQMQAPQPSLVAVVERVPPDPRGQGSATGSTDLVSMRDPQDTPQGREKI